MEYYSTDDTRSEMVEGGVVKGDTKMGAHNMLTCCPWLTLSYNVVECNMRDKLSYRIDIRYAALPRRKKGMSRVKMKEKCFSFFAENAQAVTDLWQTALA